LKFLDYYKMVEETTNKSAFNLAAMLVQDMHLSLMRASQCFAINDPSGCVKHLKICYMRFVQNLNAEERKSMKEIEAKTGKHIAAYSLAKSKTGPYAFDPKKCFEIIHEPLQQAMAAVELYNEKVLDMMEKYDLLLKKSRDRTRIN